MPDALREQLEQAVDGHYTRLRQLARGAMAVVFVARRRRDGKQVAIKVMDPSLTVSLGLERFRREIRIVAELDHPHIVPVVEFADAGDLMYYVMDYVDGESLRTTLDREGIFDLGEALRITGEIGAALAYAHGRGVIHRDIKPENVLLTDGRAVVTDFGVARAIEEAGDVLTEPGVALGTPHYMSPEQARGLRQLDGRTDIYSLGCLLYEMLTGLPPFTGSTHRTVMARRIRETPPRVRDIRSDVPKAVDRALSKALATDPDDRYTSATQFVEALANS
jgi:serine/threonine-protein kinase